jgi:glycosyltransferase involved in cell wall biosynthesis
MHSPLERADEIQAAPAKGASRSLLHVTRLSTTDLVGGAGLAVTRLHEELLRNGVASRMLVAIRRSKHDSVSTVRPFPFLPDGPGRVAFAVCRRIQHRKRCTEGGLFSLGRVCCRRNLLSQLPACNLIHLHWIVDMVDYATVLPELARRVALVWTFHDMNCFTGGCHYDGHCGRFAAACGLCPQLGSSKENDLSRWAFARKQKALARIPTNRLVIVCPSEWMANKVSLSPLFQRFRRVTIPYGIDTDLFGPTSREQARAKLGLPLHARILLFVAEIVADRGKGFGLLLQALEGLRNVSNLFVVSLGSKPGTQLAATPHRHLDRIDDPARLVLAYNSADAFIVPSRQDNLPNTVLEAMACGLPVIGFRVGVSPRWYKIPRRDCLPIRTTRRTSPERYCGCSSTTRSGTRWPRPPATCDQDFHNAEAGDFLRIAVFGSLRPRGNYRISCVSSRFK